MRPPTQPQSALRNPLNYLLGTEGNIRILRSLTETNAAMSVGEIARQSQLERSGVRRSLQALTDFGVLHKVGLGAAPQYTLRPGHPLTGALIELFGAERKHAGAVLDGIRQAVARLSPPPVAVWIEGPVASGKDAVGDPIILRIVDGSRTLQVSMAAVRDSLEAIEYSLDVTIEVVGSTPADLNTGGQGALTQAHTALSVSGLPPSAFVPPGVSGADVSRSHQSHADLDERARELGEFIAARIAKDPTVIPRAREYVTRRLAVASSGERHELEEWDRILRTASPARLRRLLVDRGERATRLRQSLPFIGILEVNERERMLRKASVSQ